MVRVRTLEGVAELWRRTMGDPGVCVAILDGPADTTHPCFRGADLTRLDSHWADSSRPIPEVVEHSTFITSLIVGQPGSEVEGLAPHCRCLNIPVMHDEASMLEPVSLVHAINVAFRAGADIIHVASCIPTKLGNVDDLVARAIRGCLRNNVLVVAPGGNDKGECLCVPAAVPGVLAVGAYDDDGKPARFSNWGGVYQSQGILAPGVDIEGAAPGGGTAVHKGTSCAAPIVTGIAALLMSVQLQRGWGLDALLVRDALLESAIPSTDPDPEERRRALRGFLNVPAAVRKLFALAAANAWAARRVPMARRPGEPDQIGARPPR